MRILARIGASILIFAGLIAVAAAVTAMKVVGKDDVVTMRPSTLHTDTAAITTAKGLLSVYGSDLHVRVTATNPKEKLWLGVAYQDDLDSYLGKTSRTNIVAYSYPNTLSTDDHTDEDVALKAPGGLDWWLAKAKGTGSVDLVWPLKNAPTGIILMNQNGSRKIDASLTLGLQLEGVYETAELIGAGGAVALLGGLAIFVVTRRRRKPSGATTGEQS